MPQNSDNCVSLFCSVNGSDLDPEEPVKVEEPAPTKKPPKEQRSIKEMPFITSDEFNGIPAWVFEINFNIQLFSNQHTWLFVINLEYIICNMVCSSIDLY